MAMKKSQAKTAESEVPMTEDPTSRCSATETQPTPVSEDEELVAVQSSMLSPAEAEARRLSRMPPVGHLEPGVLTGPDGETYAAFEVGSRIVAERFSSILSTHPWLDTRVYRVNSIDDESGVARCTDEELEHFAAIGFKHPFTRVYLAPEKGDPFKPPKRGFRSEPKVTPVQSGKKKRGRPKGSKNRPRTVVAAEKKARAEARALSPRRKRKTRRTRERR